MHNDIVYALSGKPVPLARPRFSKITAKVYDSQQTSKLGDRLSIQCQHGNAPMIDYPVELIAIFSFKPPYQSLKKDMTGEPHIARPDLDNLIKYVADICSSIVYTDDKYIAQISARKVYGKEEGTTFIFKRM